MERPIPQRQRSAPRRPREVPSVLRGSYARQHQQQLLCYLQQRASPITECTATTASSSLVIVFQVPLPEAAVVAICATAVAVTGPVHGVPRYLAPLADLGGSDDGSSAMAQQATLAGLGMQCAASVGSASVQPQTRLTRTRRHAWRPQHGEPARLKKRRVYEPFDKNKLCMANLDGHIGQRRSSQLLEAGFDNRPRGSHGTV